MKKTLTFVRTERYICKDNDVSKISIPLSSSKKYLLCSSCFPSGYVRKLYILKKNKIKKDILTYSHIYLTVNTYMDFFFYVCVCVGGDFKLMLWSWQNSFSCYLTQFLFRISIVSFGSHFCFFAKIRRLSLLPYFGSF